MNDVIMILGMVAVTFGVRYPPLAIISKLDLPENVIRALQYVPVAVLTAITIPAIIMPDGTIDIGISNAYFYAGIFTIVVAWRTKNLLLTIILGMLFFFVWRILL